MDPTNASGSSSYELNNNLELYRTPVKQFIKFDYKKLQAFVAAMGLPSNLKRKQLLAIIVAKKMGKDNMIPAILKEVTRQRNQKKKQVREVIKRQMLTDQNIYNPPTVKKKPIATSLHYQPCFGLRAPNQTIKYDPPKHQDSYLSTQQGFQNRTETYTSNNYVESTLEPVPYNQYTSNSSPATQTTYEYYYDTSKIKRYPTPTAYTYTTTRAVLHMSSATSVTPWYHKTLCSASEKQVKSSSHASNNVRHSTDKIFSSSSPQQAENTLQIPDHLVEITLNECRQSDDLNLDSILDYVMGDDKDKIENMELLTYNEQKDSEASRSSLDCESDSLNVIHEMNLLYYAQLANRALWPLKRSTFTYNNICSYIFDCLSPISSDTSTSFFRSLRAIPHSFEIYSHYKQKTCIYSGAYALHNTSQDKVPDCCLLQPEHSLSYGVPKMYYSSRNYTNEYNSAHALNNYTYQPNRQEDLSQQAYAQVHYNIHMPQKKHVESSENSTKNIVDLKVRHKKPLDNSILDVEPTITPLSTEEERTVFNSLDDIKSININIQDPSRQMYRAEHESQCCNVLIPCPFLYNYCGWFDNVPMIAKHLRQMHSEKMVIKKVAEYHINFIHLETLKDNGVKILQEHNNRLYCISLCHFDLYIFVTLQVFCEQLEQHGDKIKGSLVCKHPSGLLSWSGCISSVFYPSTHLWRPECALIIPMQHLKHYQSPHFRLLVEIGV